MNSWTIVVAKVRFVRLKAETRSMCLILWSSGTPAAFIAP